MMGDATRAEQLRNIDQDGMCIAADGYVIGSTEDNQLVIVPDVGGRHQFGIFLDAEAALDFLDRLTAEMQAMGFLS